jgi:hypothetical protein
VILYVRIPEDFMYKEAAALFKTPEVPPTESSSNDKNMELEILK